VRLLAAYQVQMAAVPRRYIVGKWLVLIVRLASKLALAVSAIVPS